MKTFEERYCCVYAQQLEAGNVSGESVDGSLGEQFDKCEDGMEEYDTDSSDGFWSGRLRTQRGGGEGWELSRPWDDEDAGYRYRSPLKTFAYWLVATGGAGAGAGAGAGLGGGGSVTPPQPGFVEDASVDGTSDEGGERAEWEKRRLNGVEDYQIQDCRKRMRLLE